MKELSWAPSWSLAEAKAKFSAGLKTPGAPGIPAPAGARDSNPVE
jgi:hypothetical protein